ncbi:defensin beta 4A-like isoform X2 [Callospermophilus lateralis]|uniref:defensin beta 4A-like isoform X2 n=1 Tax=Callospermophilus lateralis TaxID=76772 RepID=UPI00405392CD
MKIQFLLLAFLLVFLLPPPGEMGHISNPVSCLRNGGLCRAACPRRLKKIGTCGISGPKCCRAK